MNHVQTKFNLDGSICIDYYSDSLLTDETICELEHIVEYVQEKLQKKLRKNPFVVTVCTHCGHMILTNRDYFDTVKCQNCQEQFTMFPNNSNTNNAFLKELNSLFGKYNQECEHMLCYMLCILPDDVVPEILYRILETFGFNPADENNLYRNLLSIAKANDFISENSRFVYAVTELSSQDCYFDGLIPRVESCDRMIRRYFKKAYTVSADVSADSSPTQKLSVREQIEKLISENRLDEAASLLDQL